MLNVNQAKKDLINSYFPGVCLSFTIGCAAMFLSAQYSVPAMLMALLLGLAFHFLDDVKKCQKGLMFASKTLLRIGVALLGLRITISQVESLGWQPVLLLVCAVVGTLLFGVFLARLLGFSYSFGALSGGSVAICGASAAMAISAILPQNEQAKKDTLITIIGVTTLSTFAMIAYPIIAEKLGLNAELASLFLGATIHDVAQVTGAGYSMSNEIGDLSTFFKLLRVAMLVPVVLVMSYFINAFLKSNTCAKKSIVFPKFLIGFVVLFLVNSFIVIPEQITELANSVSKTFLLTAVAALGVQMSLEDMSKVGIRPVILIVSETIFIALIVLIMMQFI